MKLVANCMINRDYTTTKPAKCKSSKIPFCILKSKTMHKKYFSSDSHLQVM